MSLIEVLALCLLYGVWTKEMVRYAGESKQEIFEWQGNVESLAKARLPY